MTSSDAWGEDSLTVQRPAALAARATAHTIDLMVTGLAIAVMRPFGFTWLVPALAVGLAGALLGGDSLGRRLSGITATGTYGGKASIVGVVVRDLLWTSIPAVVALAYASALPLLGVAVMLGTNALGITLRDNVGVADLVTQTRLGSDGL